VRHQLNCPEPDAVLSIETHLFNVTLAANSCQYHLDVGKELWLNQSRWSRLIKEYVAAEALERFISQCLEIVNGDARLGATANFLFRDPDRYAKKHRWGGCLMGAVFRGDNKKSGPATLTFYSRTTYMGYMGMLDACIAHCMANEITRRWIGVDHVKNYMMADDHNIQFRWHIGSMQLHAFKTLPFIFSQPDLFSRLKFLASQPKAKDMTPTWKHTSNWYRKIREHWDGAGHDVDTFLNGEKYGPFRRIKRRWCEHMGYLSKHIPPSLKPDQLDFDKAV
jgi:hypothetical protein